MIRRVVINLLENAAKYTPPNQEIEIGAEAGAKDVRLWVLDHGTGIGVNDRKRIFDKYTRLASSGAPKGLGLGLAFCRLAVEAHKGQIWVENAPSEGAMFIFTLPAASAPAAGSTDID
jgi:signal transduction histidine kinase